LSFNLDIGELEIFLSFVIKKNNGGSGEGRGREGKGRDVKGREGPYPFTPPNPYFLIRS